MSKHTSRKKYQKDKELVNDHNYGRIQIIIPVDKEDFSKIETKSKICFNVLCYENKLLFPRYISDQKCKNSIDLFLISSENKSHYVYFKDFNRFMLHKTKNKNKKCFFKSCLQCFSNKSGNL